MKPSVKLILGLAVCLAGALAGIGADNGPTCAASIPSSRCPPEWTPFGAACYKVMGEGSQRISRERRQCSDMGSVLVAPYSDEENDFLVNLVGDEERFWINCKRQQDSGGAWVCGEIGSPAVYRNWEEDQPVASHRCAYVEAGGHGKWHSTADCWDSSLVPKVVCKIKKPPAVLHF